MGGPGEGETALQIETELPREFVIILQGILIFSVVDHLPDREAPARGEGAPAGRRGASSGPPDGRGREPRGRASSSAEGAGLMPFADLGVALQISFTYFTILYLTGLGGLFSERSGIVNIGLEGLMIIGTVTGSFGARFFTDTVGLGLPWGPILGCCSARCAGPFFAGVHAVATVTFRVDHIVSGVVINLVAIGLARFLSHAFFGQATQSDPGGPHLAEARPPAAVLVPVGPGRAFKPLADGPGRGVHGRSGWSPCTAPLGPATAFVRREPRGDAVARRRVAPLRYQGVLLSGALAGLRARSSPWR